MFPPNESRLPRPLSNLCALAWLTVFATSQQVGRWASQNVIVRKERRGGQKAVQVQPYGSLLQVHDLTRANVREQPIDFVYTWVNESDPAWNEIHTKESGMTDSNSAADANLPARFRSFDELRYSLHSLRQFMEPSQLGHIFIVTAGQTPDWLGTENQEVSVVSHWDIIPSQFLPAGEMTYNSFAIECWLHMIPGLSEQFVYMNDDMFFAAPVLRGDLFDDLSRPRIAFQTDWGRTWQNDPNADAYSWAVHNNDVLLDGAYNPESRYKVLHQAYPLTKSLYDQAHEVFKDAIEATTRNKFRSKTDIIPHYLAAWVGIYTEQAVRLAEDEYPSNQYIELRDNSSLAALTELLEQPQQVRFLCIGNKIENETAAGGMQQSIAEFFTQYFSTDKPPWEK